jgi:hypothetical protein
LTKISTNGLSVALPEWEKSLAATFCPRNRAALAGLLKN